MEEFIVEYVRSLKSALDSLPHEGIRRFGECLQDAWRNGASVFVIGNGGSAATASHLAMDLGKLAPDKNGNRIRVLSLTDNIPWISAIANDLEYNDIFAEQLKNFARPGDLLIAISTSGNSRNVLRAVRFANKLGCTTFCFTGASGGELIRDAQHCVRVATDHTGIAEDLHLILQHIVIYYFGTIKNVN